jgi:methylisocitrate lyase
MGNPDIGLTSVTETALIATNVASATRVPIIVDADNGYGNEDNVMRTVFELEHSGAAAMIMEDQISPKRCGHTAGKKVEPLSQYMKKLECALRGRQTPLCIVARTDVMDLDEAIQRARAFHSAGADVVLVDGLPSLDAAKRVADEVPGHKQINLIYGGKTPILPAAELEKLGFKIVLYSTPALYVAANAILRSMKVLRERRDLNAISDASVKFADFQEFIESAYKKRYPALT